MDEFTEVEHESWFSRIGESIKGILFGIILFIVAWPLLFWNEGQTVKTTRALNEGQGATVGYESPDNVDSGNEGKLVHMIGSTATDDILNDDQFGISVNAVRLVRTAEMYQWEEDVKTKEKKNLGGGKTKDRP